MTLTVYPTATPHMKDNLAVTDGKIGHLAAFCESIRLEVMPLIRACVTFIKINMKIKFLYSSLCKFTCVLFDDICHVKEIQNTIWKQKANQSLIVEC